MSNSLDLVALVKELAAAKREQQVSSTRNRKAQIRRRSRRVRHMLELLHLLRVARSVCVSEVENQIRCDSQVTRQLWELEKTHA